MDDSAKEVLRDFLTEAFDGLDQLDQDFVALEAEPGNASLLGRIFRNIHSIKGASGFFGFHQLESLAHAGENLLGMARDRTVELDQEMTTVLLAMVDKIRFLLTQIQQNGQESEANCQEVIARLTEIHQRSLGGARAPVAQPAPTPEPPSEPSKSALAPAAAAAVATAKAAVTAGSAAPAEATPAANTDSTVKIQVEVLDKLMNLTGELVLVRNQLCEAERPDPRALQRLSLITSELQEGVMKTRMQPIDGILSKYPRVIRDLAMSCGKKVRLEMEGRETELDRSVIDAMKDPLTHLVRNAIDHGIEPPEGRQAAGKPEEGCLRIRAYHEGGLVNVEIADDGRGLDPDKLRRKAVEKGIISEAKAAELTDREAINVIFLPGFSTAEKVTNVSGRGVGMDVVRSNIEKIGGTIDIETQLGKGTLFKIKIPLTLAIIPALIVHSAQTRYAIPLSSLVELVRVEKGGLGVEFIHGAPVYRLREHLLPLLYLDRELGAVPPGADYGVASHIVVLQAGDRPFGLVVDRIHDTQEVVVKPLGRQLKGSPVFSGATILGDGKVSLIIDVLNFAKRAHVVSEVAEKAQRDAEAGATIQAAASQMLVLVQSPGKGQLAIPFSTVSRLEKFRKDALEKVGAKTVVQYRKGIMPLVALSELLEERRKLPRDPEPGVAEREALDVVVFSAAQGSAGLIVEKIVDIIEESITEASPPSRTGIVGCFVYRNKVTEILDVDYAIQRAFAPPSGEA